MAFKRPWWRRITEVFVKTPGRCVAKRNYSGDIVGCQQSPYSWLWGHGEYKDCGDDCLP
ncbi:hypothetical protein [uncultured Flavobacterium sp.]|uniref:hypothetical protein n=1 Tax=uncultured Flavobacterium sp. TaxID=165435 RepID=UPI0030C7D3E2